MSWFSKKSDNTALKAFVAEVEKEQPPCTDDVYALEQRQCQLLFVYDEMMSRHREYKERIEPYSTCVATAFTKDKFSLWKRDLKEQSFPIPLEVGYTGAPLAAVKGELYIIASKQLISIDNYKANGLLYARKRIKVNVPYRRYDQWGTLQPLEYRELKAWMYVGLDKWNELLDSGYTFKPVKLYKPNDPNREKYYYFTISECNN